MPATVRITGRTLLLVRAATDLVDLIGETVSLTREPDGRYRGRCSLQQPEESHDFEVRRRPDMDAWYCSTCGRGGDLVTWVMDRRGLGFEGAVRYLAERAGIPVGYEPMPAGPQRVQR